MSLLSGNGQYKTGLKQKTQLSSPSYGGVPTKCVSFLEKGEIRWLLTVESESRGKDKLKRGKNRISGLRDERSNGSVPGGAVTPFPWTVKHGFPAVISTVGSSDPDYLQVQSWAWTSQRAPHLYVQLAWDTSRRCFKGTSDPSGGPSAGPQPGSNAARPLRAQVQIHVTRGPPCPSLPAGPWSPSPQLQHPQWASTNMCRTLALRQVSCPTLYTYHLTAPSQPSWEARGKLRQGTG